MLRGNVKCAEGNIRPKEKWNMNRFTSLCFAGIAAAAFSLSASAQTTTPATPATPKVHDCSKAHNPAHCEARKQAFVACKDKAADAERHSCMKANMRANQAPKS
jgi:hypothetical protein